MLNRPQQISLWPEEYSAVQATSIDVHSYDHIILAMSGGKDSIACFLYLIELGVQREKIELWHHLVDGREGSTLMDWPVTGSYCRAIAAAFGVKIFFSWKQGGFEGEMLRDNARTAPTRFQAPNGPEEDNLIECSVGGHRGKLGTRKRFPQQSADLRTRWCSAYLKIDVCTAAINNQRRFIGKRTLVITGERAEESSARAKYKQFEPDWADNRTGKRIRRLVDRWRPVHGWNEQKVWEIIERHKVVPHPAYQLGWSRLSCISCIFGSPNQWASLHKIDPGRFKRLADYEAQFGTTIHRTRTLWDQVIKGSPYPNMDPLIVKQGLSCKYTGNVLTDIWTLPSGAFGENAGPS